MGRRQTEQSKQQLKLLVKHLRRMPKLLREQLKLLMVHLRRMPKLLRGQPASPLRRLHPQQQQRMLQVMAQMRGQL